MTSVPTYVRFGWHICRMACLTPAQHMAFARITMQTAQALTPWALMAAAEARRTAPAARTAKRKPARKAKVSTAAEAAPAAKPGAAKRGGKRSPSMPAPLPELRADLLA